MIVSSDTVVELSDDETIADVRLRARRHEGSIILFRPVKLEQDRDKDKIKKNKDFFKK